jgi:hypothetical protein
MILCFSAVTLVAGAILAAGIYSPTVGSSSSSTPPLSNIDSPLIMLSFGIVLCTFGRALARDEERYLLEFLIRTLDVREVPTTGRQSDLR